MQKKSVTGGGSLENALRGDYDFDVKAVLKEGVALTQNSKLAIIQGLLVVFALAYFSLLGAEYLSIAKNLDSESPDFQFILHLIIAILVAPLTAGLLMMGVNTSLGIENRLEFVFRFISRIVILGVATLMTTAAVQIGLLFFIVPGLYLAVATGFTVPLILDKGMMPAQAMMTSIKVVGHRWKQFVLLYLAFTLLLLLVVVTYGVAIIWVAPFYYNVKGLLYRDIFGIGTDASQNLEYGHREDDDVFSA